MKYSNNCYNKKNKLLARSLRKNSTPAERKIWKLLLSRKQTGIKFLRQRPIDSFIVDFVCLELKLIIEIDGSSHLFYETEQKDKIKQSRLNLLGFEIVRIKERDVIYDFKKVEKLILRLVHYFNENLSNGG